MNDRPPTYEAWCARFDAVEHEISTLFHNRFVWRNLVTMSEAAAAPEDLGIARMWINRGYVSMQCLGIRRLDDKDARTASLRQVLGQLARWPDILTRARWEASARDLAASTGISTEVLQARAIDGFAAFADETGDRLDIRRIHVDLTSLQKATNTVSRYADTRLAHNDFRPSTGDGTVTFGVLDRAIVAIGDLWKRYYPLRHPGAVPWQLTPITPPVWVAAFERPWWNDGIDLVSEEELG